MAVPTSIGYFFTVIYNVVDTYWAGAISDVAVAGLGISFPIYLLMLAVSMGLGMGTTVLVTHQIGAKNEAKAGETLVQALLLAVISSLLLLVGGLMLMPMAFELLSPTAEVAQAGRTYFTPIIILNIFFVASFTLNSSLNAVGDTIAFSIMSVATTFLNMALDPLLIYGWGPIPAMGLAGIGWATVISQALGVAFIFYRVTKTSLWQHMVLRRLKLKWPAIKEILSQGVPSGINMVAISAGFVIMLYFVKPYGMAATAGFTAGLRIEQLALLPAFGLNTAAISLVGQNMGAGQFNRALMSFRSCGLIAHTVLTLGGVLIFFFAQDLVSFFGLGQAAEAKAVSYLKIVAFEYPALCFIALGGGFLQSIQKPHVTMMVTILRLGLMPMVAMPFFATYLGFGYNGVWYGILFSSYAFAAVMIILINHYGKQALGVPPISLQKAQGKPTI
jgi:putative MATE family efflux protein